ncbi:MAG: hypothetical protein AAF327_00830 [Cyanobacteria bacterium P01_A01_bin.37]
MSPSDSTDSSHSSHPVSELPIPNQISMASLSVPPKSVLEGVISFQLVDAIAHLQRCFPTSYVTTEWITSHSNQLVVRATVYVGTMPLGSAMAMAPSIEQAEDQAKLRAIASVVTPYAEVAGYKSIPQHQLQTPVLNNSPTVKQSPPPPLPSENNLHEATSHPPESSLVAIQEDVSVDDDWITSMDTPDTPPPPSSLDMDDSDVELPPDIVELNHTPLDAQPSSSSESRPPKKSRTKKATSSKPSSASKNEEASIKLSTLPEPASNPRTLSVDLSDIIAKTSVELKRLGWTDVQGREHLQKIYGKRSRQQLTDPELLDFLTHLESLAT